MNVCVSKTVDTLRAKNTFHFFYFAFLFVRNEERTKELVSGSWVSGTREVANAACGQVTRNRFELTPKFIILLIYRNLLKPWPGLAGSFINNCNRLTRALSINGISFGNLFRYLSFAVEQFRDRSLSIISMFG